MEDFKNRKELPRGALEELFQKTLTIWNNLEFDIDKGRPQWPTLNGTKVYKLAEISSCSSMLDTAVINLELDFDYDCFEAGFAGAKDHSSVEIMFVDFLLHYLADELGYDLIEFQNDEHYQLYLIHKDDLEAGGWIPYDGKGMPEGLEEKMIYILCFGANETKFPLRSYAREGKYWSWHHADGEGYFNASCIAFYKIKEKPVGKEGN